MNLIQMDQPQIGMTWEKIYFADDSKHGHDEDLTDDVIGDVQTGTYYCRTK